MRTHEDDQVPFAVCPVTFTEERPDDWKAPQAGNSCFKVGFRVVDLTAEDDECLVRNMDAGGHVRVRCRDPDEVQVGRGCGA